MRILQRVAVFAAVLAGSGAQAQYPSNGGFETWSGSPASWTTSGTVTQGTTSGVQGANYAKISAASSSITSDFFPIIGPVQFDSASADRWVAVSLQRKTVSGSGSVTLSVAFYDGLQAAISTSTDTFPLDNANNWQVQQSTALQVPATARYVKLTIALPASSSEVHIDSVVFDSEERWHPVGGAGTNDPAFNGSWVNFGNPYAPARFRRDAAGWVTIEGLVKSGTLGTTVFTLPAGYRPYTNQNLYQSEVMNNATGILEVQSGGAVIQQAGASNAHLSLQIKFKAEQ